MSLSTTPLADDGRSLRRRRHGRWQPESAAVGMATTTGTDDTELVPVSKGDGDRIRVDPFGDEAAMEEDEDGDEDEGEDEVGDDEDAGPGSSAWVFRPSLQLQIETVGKALLSRPGPMPADPIPVYVVDEGVEGVRGVVPQQQPAFVSLRESRRSGDHVLVAGGAPWTRATSPVVVLQTLSTTTYRFGPGRPPQVCLAVEDAAETLELRRRRVLGRARFFRSRLGTFAWRYGSRDEQRSAAASLLVLDRVAMTYRSSSAAATELRRPVARLVRSAALRSAGSAALSAGNGGRLQLDEAWLADEPSTAADRDAFVVLAVTTCLVMLKKETDRRRARQVAIMGGVIGGG